MLGQEGLDQINWEGEDDRRVLLRTENSLSLGKKEDNSRDGVQCLEIAELESRGGGGDDVGGFFQGEGGLLLSLGDDQLGAGFAGRLGFGSHGSLELLGKADILDFDTLHVDSPGLCGFIQGDLKRPKVTKGEEGRTFMDLAIPSLSESISESFFVPRMFLRVV